MKRKKVVAENGDTPPKAKKYKKKIENPEKQKVRYVYDNKGFVHFFNKNKNL